MSRIQQDQFIDEDEEEEVCPLCVEEFDLGDRYFKPCPCGYQICQFCYNNIKTTMNGLCPACRRPYDDKPFSFKNVTQEELLQHEKNKAAQLKRRAAAKQKEAQKREADNLSRKHLAGLRVRQRNLVYVTGMRPKIQGDRVAELLREKAYFGQYGDIIKVVVSKSKDAAHTPNQPVGIYVTFAKKEDAAACIEAINAAAQAGDGKIRAQHGTTKYCSAYLRGEMCNNRNCMFLHEPGESAESFTRQDLSNMNASATQQPSDDPISPDVQATPQNVQPMAAAAQDNSPTSPIDSSALPAGANWARRGSRATSSSVASPVVTTTVPAKSNGEDSSNAKSSKDSSSDSVPSRPTSSASTSKLRKTREQSAFHNLLKVAFNPNMKFNFSPTGLSDDDIKLLNTLPPLWDPQGGAKRRIMKEREAEESRKREEESLAALQEAAPTEPVEHPETELGGSLQLGGEPEERPERVFGQQSAIQGPAGYAFGQQFSLDNDLSGLSIRGGTPTQQHQSQLLLRQLQSVGTSQHQIGTHGRQPSRFSFSEAGGLRAAAGLQQPNRLGGGFNMPGQQAPSYSGVQGPPPGLRTTGTPPVNGGSMFGQGHGFTSGYGASAATRDAADRAWDVRTGQRVGAQEAMGRKDELPSLGQSLDPPRRATPTLPPGLFPEMERTLAPTPETEKKPAEIVELKIEDKPPIDSPTAEVTAIEDKGKAPAVTQPVTPVKATSQNPTFAKRAASVLKKETKAVPVKVAAVINVLEEAKVKSIPATKAVVEQKFESPTSKRPPPGKLNIDTTPLAAKEKENDSPAKSTSSKPEASSRLSRAPSISGLSLSSRPGTPLATVVATGSPLKRTTQPRTLRITDTPKSETPPPLPTVTATASPATATPPPVTSPPHTVSSKVMSRRASIASLNQPGTPLTDRADTMSVTSTSASRANSPPPLAVRKSKKKDLKKKEKAADVAAIIAPKAPEEDVGPIMARKTKSKKSSRATSGPTPVVKSTAPPPSVIAAIAEEKVEDDVKAKAVQNATNSPATSSFNVPAEAKKIESALKVTPKAATTTATTPATPPPPREEKKPQEKKEQSPNPLTAATILTALESTHQLAVSTLSLLKPLTSQSGLKNLGIDPFTSADLQNHIEQLRFELTKADEQLLKQGQAVRRDLGEQAAGRGRVSGKCFVTPAGTRLSCLTKEEEEKYVEIERRVMQERGISRWGGAGMSHITKQALKPKKNKLQSTLAQEDVLRALSIATESLEGALREATKDTNVKVEAHLGPASVHLAGQTVAPPTRADGHPQDPTMDAREYVNKFVPRSFDPHPTSVAVPPTEDDVDNWGLPTNGAAPGWNSRRLPIHTSGQTLEVTPQLLADASAAAGLAPRPELNLLPPSAHLPLPHHTVSSSSSSSPSQALSNANTAAAMDTFEEAMATAGAIAKLGANEALKSPADILRSGDKAMASAAPSGSPKNLQLALEKAVKREAGVGSGSGRAAAMSMAELEREGLRERVAESKRENAEWERKVNKVMRINRKMVLGHQ